MFSSNCSSLVVNVAAKSGTGLSMISSCSRYGLGASGITEGVSSYARLLARYVCQDTRRLLREHTDGELAGGIFDKAIG